MLCFGPRVESPVPAECSRGRARLPVFEMQMVRFAFHCRACFLDTPERRLLNYAVFFCTKFQSVGTKELF